MHLVVHLWSDFFYISHISFLGNPTFGLCSAWRYDDLATINIFDTKMVLHIVNNMSIVTSQWICFEYGVVSTWVRDKELRPHSANQRRGLNSQTYSIEKMYLDFNHFLAIYLIYVWLQNTLNNLLGSIWLTELCDQCDESTMMVRQ